VEQGVAYDWPIPARRTTTVRDAISDLPPVEGGTYSDFREYREPRTAFQRWVRSGVRGDDRHRVYDHSTRAVREDDLEAFRLMDHRTRYSDLPEHLRRYRADIFDDKYKRLQWNDVSRTITAHIAKDGYWYIHPEQHRTLTIREAARLQTFPDCFRFAGFRTNAFRQIGNAVPPLLGAAVGRQIFKVLRNSERRQHHHSSRELSTVLATWIGTQEEHELAQPWRRRDDLWHTLLGLVLFEKAKPIIAQNFWPTYARRWNTPRSYLEDPRKEAATRAIGRSGAGGLLGRIAHVLTESEDALLSGDRNVSGLSREKLAYAATLCGYARSFQPTSQTTRIAQRVFGEVIRDSRIEQQLALVRLIGALHSGPAYGALLEVGDRLCLPAEPRCHACPLREMCVTGQKRTAELHPMLFSGRD
jgi:DNA (cytosine-5)-methyltransferase 1